MHIRDCARKNILVDSNALFPRGYHPLNPFRLPDSNLDAPVLSRAVAPVKYYYVDFGISSYIPADSETKLVLGDFGRDKDVPELSLTTPYDPFKVDIFIIGNLLSKEFLQVRLTISHSRISSHPHGPRYIRTSDS